MQWMEIIRDWGIYGFIIVGLVFLIRLLIRQFFQMDLEKYKSQLNVELEKHKADLQRAAIQYQITYSKLHADRADVIVELNKKMAKTNRSLRSFISPFQPPGVSMKEKYEEAYLNSEDFEFFYESSKVFFDKKIYTMIDSMVVRIREAWNIYTLNRCFEFEKEEHPDIQKEKTKAWIESWEIIREDIPKIQENLQEEFRELLSEGGPISSESADKH